MIVNNIAVAPETHIAEICGGGRLSSSHCRAKRRNCELGPRTYGRQPKYAVPYLQTRRMDGGGSPRRCANRFSSRQGDIGGPAYPHALLICQICGFTYFINSVRIGISKASETLEKEEKQSKAEEKNG